MAGQACLIGFRPGVLASNGDHTLEASQSARGEETEQDSQYIIFERADDWSSCALFYLDSPCSQLPPIEAVNGRTEGLIEIDDAKRCEIDWSFCTYPNPTEQSDGTR